MVVVVGAVVVVVGAVVVVVVGAAVVVVVGATVVVDVLATVVVVVGAVVGTVVVVVVVVDMVVVVVGIVLDAVLGGMVVVGAAVVLGSQTCSRPISLAASLWYCVEVSVRIPATWAPTRSNVTRISAYSMRAAPRSRLHARAVVGQCRTVDGLCAMTVERPLSTTTLVVEELCLTAGR